jgi:hypothetical protein
MLSKIKNGYVGYMANNLWDKNKPYNIRSYELFCSFASFAAKLCDEIREIR